MKNVDECFACLSSRLAITFSKGASLCNACALDDVVRAISRKQSVCWVEVRACDMLACLQYLSYVLLILLSEATTIIPEATMRWWTEGKRRAFCVSPPPPRRVVFALSLYTSRGFVSCRYVRRDRPRSMRGRHDYFNEPFNMLRWLNSLRNMCVFADVAFLASQRGRWPKGP